MAECLVEYEYVAAEEDELTIKPGEIISNVRKLDGGWWEGEIGGKKGMFPDNFVKELKQEPKKSADVGNRASVKKVGAGAGSHVAELANRLGKEGAIRIGPQSPNAPTVLRRDNSQVNKKRIRVKATFSYVPENEDELQLEIGDILEVTKQEEEGWWEGVKDGKQGMFPSNFVEVFDEDAAEKSQGEASGDEVSTPDGEFREIQGKKVKGVGLGNIFSAGPIKLRSTQTPGPPPAAGKRELDSNKHHVKEPAVPHDNNEKRDSIKRPPPPVPKDPPTLPPKDSPPVKQLERARVLYSYSAENEDELSIEEGDTIVILDKELEDNGWWKGEVHGKVGVFPDNFVELLPPEEVQKPKKPPPPAMQPTKVRTEKPQIDPVKPADHAKAEPHRAVPSLPGRKPVMPPPVGKKPAKHADPKLMAQTDDHKVKESQKEMNHLDSVETTEKLNHPTANRARAPTRRLPSSIHGKDQASPPPQPKKQEEDRLSGGSEPNSPRLKHKSNARGSLARKVESVEDKPMREDIEHKHASKSVAPKVMRPPPPTPTKEERPIVSPTHHNDRQDAATNVTVDELRKEIEHLKANTVSKNKYEELQTELSHLKESVAHLKSSFNKKLLDLMTEIDEEKKVRLNMQVEIDRVKKLALT